MMCVFRSTFLGGGGGNTFNKQSCLSLFGTTLVPYIITLYTSFYVLTRSPFSYDYSLFMS